MRDMELICLDMRHVFNMSVKNIYLKNSSLLMKTSIYNQDVVLEYSFASYLENFKTIYHLAVEVSVLKQCFLKAREDRTYKMCQVLHLHFFFLL